MKYNSEGTNLDKESLINAEEIVNKQFAASISWREVEVRVRKTRKGIIAPPLLKKVSGSANPGEFLAIIGESGAGKTTLLNYLVGQLSSNIIGSGPVLINGIPRELLKSTRIYGFVQQKDELLDLFSIRETLMFAAKMRVKGLKQEREVLVQKVIDELELQEDADSRLKDIIKRGGTSERKRTSIGIELVSNLPILFLDEPTTGLDSYMATKVIEILRKLTLKGRTIIATIHQPNSQMFELFDRLMLLSLGHVIYNGKGSEAIQYFTQQGYPCPQNYNPCEYFLEVMTSELFTQGGAILPSHPHLAYILRLEQLVQYYYLNLAPNICEREEFEVVSESESVLGRKFLVENVYIASWGKQLTMLIKRGIVGNLREPQASTARLILIIIIGLSIMATNWNLPYDDTIAVMDREGICFLLNVGSALIAMQHIILIFPQEKPVLLREQISSLYSLSSYYIAKLISELPFFIIYPTIYTLMIYYPCNLNDYDYTKVLISVLAMIAMYCLGASYALLSGSIVSDLSATITLLLVFVVPLLPFSGFLINQKNINYALYPLNYFSAFLYGFTILITNEFTDSKLHKKGVEGNFGEMNLSALNLDFNIWESFIILIGLFIVLNCLAFCILKYKTKKL